jgi:group I intron endonuclease
MAAIYKITNTVNNKVYIGQTINSINKRFNSHLQGVNRKNICSALYSAFIKYGKDKFIIESIVAGDYSKEELNELEVFYIKKHNSLSPNGYNLQSGGSSFMVVDSVKNQTSKKMKGRKIEWSEKIRETMKKKWLDPKYREEMVKKHSRPYGKYKKHSKPLRLNLNIVEIEKMYNNGDSIYKIAKHFSVSFSVIKKRINNGI